MKRQDIVTLAFTFFTGFCLGVYIFFTGFMGITEDVVPDVGETVALEIIGEAYGGCQTVCPTFIVRADGSFRYLFTPGFDEEQVVREGSLPFSLQVELAEAMTRPALTAQSEELQPAFCNSYNEGVDVRYRITRAGEQYLLDTCGTRVATETALWQALVKIWNYFETIES